MNLTPFLKPIAMVLATLVACSVAAPPAHACSVPRVTPPQELVTRSDGIYRVKALSYQPRPVTDPDSGLPSSSIHFQVLEVLKGATALRLSFPGEISTRNDYNDEPVPYRFVRPEGRHGNCFAAIYVIGAEYLLLVRDGSPYWSPLAATTEQVRGGGDPWVDWVRDTLKADPGHR